MNENQRHALAHAKYLCERASPDNPDVCFDYELVQTLLSLIASPPEQPAWTQEEIDRAKVEAKIMHDYFHPEQPAADPDKKPSSQIVWPAVTSHERSTPEK